MELVNNSRRQALINAAEQFRAAFKDGNAGTPEMLEYFDDIFGDALESPDEDVRRIGPFLAHDGVYEHMGDEYHGSNAVWLYTAPIDVQQAIESRNFMRAACHEAQDIAAKAQEELAELKERHGQLNRALESGAIELLLLSRARK